MKKSCPGETVSVVDIYSEVGGGSFPDMVIPSVGLALRPGTMTIDGLEKRLRHLPVPVVARIEKEALILDMRTILAQDEKDLVAGVVSVLTNAR